MDIYEASLRYRVSLKTLKAMARDGEIRLDEPVPIISKMRAYLAKQGTLNVEHLTTLTEDRSLLDQLGPFQDKARDALKLIGTDVWNAPAAPKEVGWSLLGAASGDPVDLSVIETWLKGVLPSDPVRHQWIGVRLLLSLDPDERPQEFKRLRRVMLNLRRRESFAGWWHVQENGEQKVTFYSRPIDL